MEKTCTFCGQTFDFSRQEQDFLKKMRFTFGKVTVDLPEPEHCPACRLQLKTCHRNERFLYKGKSALSGKDMVSLYAEPYFHDYKVYSQDEWHGDKWEAQDHTLKLDLERPLFDQWYALHQAVPRMGLITVSNENSDFTTGTGYCKNCYLINSSEYCEDCYYGKLLQSSSDCVDSSYVYNSEQCYECFWVYGCHSCAHLLFSKNCADCHFSTNLIGCKNCLLCSNLHQKEYHIRNKPASKQEFEKAVAEFRGSASGTSRLRKELREIERTCVHRASNIVNCEDCTGDYLENCKTCRACFDLTGSEDCVHAYVGVNVKDLQHCSNMYLKVELCLDILGAIEVYHAAYCLFDFYCQDILYCEYCFHCRDCFGCIGLKHKRYCIFNTQYSKEEYEELVPKIIERMRKAGDWGKFFPQSKAPFAYNETLAQEYFPLTKKEALAKGFLWRDPVDTLPDVQKIIPAERLPDQLSDTPDDVLAWAIECEETKRPYRIIKQELQFYRNRTIPIPRRHPDVRYDERLSLRNPRRLWNRECAKCKKSMESTYQPSRPETVVCEECYRNEVF